MPKKAVLIGAVLAAVLAGWFYYEQQKQLVATVMATGTIEVTRADVMPKVAGYLNEFQLKAGDRLQKGQVVAKIVRKDLEAQLLRDQAALAGATAHLRDLQEGPRSQEKQDIAESLAGSRSVYTKAQQDFARYQALFQSGAISAQQLDTARSALEVAYHNMQSLTQKLELLEAGSRPESIEAQKQEVERNQAIIAASRSQLEDTVIVSPIDGLILTKNFENGEYVNPGAALLTLGDMADCWVKVYVPSTQLGLVQVGQAAQVRVDSFPDRYFAGTVSEISPNAEFTPRQSITQRERANMVFAVKVRINNDEGLLKPGMPADVVFQ